MDDPKEVEIMETIDSADKNSAGFDPKVSFKVAKCLVQRARKWIL